MTTILSFVRSYADPNHLCRSLRAGRFHVNATFSVREGYGYLSLGPLVLLGLILRRRIEPSALVGVLHSLQAIAELSRAVPWTTAVVHDLL